MYQHYFGLNANPFSISPDTRFLFLSDSHREAIAHLVYALGEKGGFIQLTGEVGLGKTTVCRYILGHLPSHIDVALLLNPRVDEFGLLRSICDELRLSYPPNVSATDLVRGINMRLVQNHAQGRQTILIIDEAQNLPEGTLEMVRLLTNLETNQQKLLRVVLIGQPELAATLKQRNMRQVAQRITGRFHLMPLNRAETVDYIRHRLKIAGCGRPLFTRSATALIYKLTGGTPRLINILADRALMGAYSEGLPQATKKVVKRAAFEALPEQNTFIQAHPQWAAAASVLLVGFLTWATVYYGVIDKAEHLVARLLQQPVVELPSNSAQIAASSQPDDLSEASDTADDQAINSAPNQQSQQDQDLEFRLGIPSIEPVNQR